MSDLKNIENDNDMDIKALFEKDFEADDITVSEDLISRTMASIRALEKDTSATPEASSLTEETETPSNVTSIKSRRKFLRIAYGIAAALVIGIVGFSIYRFGGTIEKSASKDDNAYMGVADSRSQSEASGERKESIAKDETYIKEMAEETKDAPNNEPNPIAEDRFKNDTNGAVSDDADNLGTIPSNYVASEIDASSYTFDLEHGKQNLRPENIISVTEKNDESGSGTEPVEDATPPETPAVTVNPDEVLSYILSDYDELFATDDTDGAATIDIKLLKECTSYNLLIHGLKSSEEDQEVQLTNVISLLEQSNGDERGEYVLAAVIQDISGVYFNDANGNPTWTTGKEYLLLYKDYISNQGS